MCILIYFVQLIVDVQDSTRTRKLYLHAYAHNTKTHLNIYIYICIPIKYTHAPHIYTYIYLHLRRFNSTLDGYVDDSFYSIPQGTVLIRACMHACMHACVCVCVCVCNIYECVCLCANPFDFICSVLLHRFHAFRSSVTSQFISLNSFLFVFSVPSIPGFFNQSQEPGDGLCAFVKLIFFLMFFFL